MISMLIMFIDYADYDLVYVLSVLIKICVLILRLITIILIYYFL